MLILAVVAAAIVIPTVHKSTSHPQSIGIVGALPTSLSDAVTASGTSIGTAVQLISEPNIAAADDDLRSGRVDIAVIDGHDLSVNTAIGTTDTSTTAHLARAISKNLGVAEAFAARCYQGN